MLYKQLPCSASSGFWCHFWTINIFFINFSKSAAPVTILYPLNDSLFLLSCCMIYPVLPSSINTLWNGENVGCFIPELKLSVSLRLDEGGGKDELLNVMFTLLKWVLFKALSPNEATATWFCLFCRSAVPSLLQVRVWCLCVVLVYLPEIVCLLQLGLLLLSPSLVEVIILGLAVTSIY